MLWTHKPTTPILWIVALRNGVQEPVQTFVKRKKLLKNCINFSFHHHHNNLKNRHCVTLKVNFWCPPKLLHCLVHPVPSCSEQWLLTAQNFCFRKLSSWKAHWLGRRDFSSEKYLGLCQVLDHAACLIISLGVTCYTVGPLDNALMHLMF